MKTKKETIVKETNELETGDIIMWVLSKRNTHYFIVEMESKYMAIGLNSDASYVYYEKWALNEILKAGNVAFIRHEDSA